MQIDEILKVAALTYWETSIQLEQKQVDSAKLLGWIWGGQNIFRVTSGSDELFFALDSENAIVAQLVLTPDVQDGKDTYRVRRAYALPTGCDGCCAWDFYAFVANYVKCDIVDLHFTEYEDSKNGELIE